MFIQSIKQESLGQMQGSNHSRSLDLCRFVDCEMLLMVFRILLFIDDVEILNGCCLGWRYFGNAGCVEETVLEREGSCAIA